MVTNELQAFDWAGKYILVACSGGVDSMVLLHGLLQLGCRPEVFHVNYQLRGADSDADAALVRTVCEQNKLVVHLHTVNGSDFKKSGVNLQNEARKVRRDFFGSWTSQSADHIVALAHHADDQEETFFLQYLRGAGMIGLGAIHPQRGQIWRPFLRLRKSALIGWATKQCVEWREDQSNFTTVYARNRLRNEILPALHRELPGLTESVLLLSGYFRQEAQLIGQKLEELLRNWQEMHEFPLTEWNKLNNAEKEVLLNRMGVSTGAVEELDKLAGMQRGKQLILGNQCFYRTRDSIALKMPPLRYEPEITVADKLPAEFSVNELYLDAGKISGELRLRNWSTDDFIEPVGMKGRISIEKVLKDGGIPQQERSNYPVLADEETILWVPGLRISRHKLADSATQKILKVVVLPSMKSGRS